MVVCYNRLNKLRHLICSTSIFMWGQYTHHGWFRATKWWYHWKGGWQQMHKWCSDTYPISLGKPGPLHQCTMEVCLLGRCSTIWDWPLIFSSYFLDMVLDFLPWASKWDLPSYASHITGIAGMNLHAWFLWLWLFLCVCVPGAWTQRLMTDRHSTTWTTLPPQWLWF
jgi:hypothetical protein